MSNAARLLLAALAFSLLAAGCGNGDGEAGSLSKAQFIKRADQICEKGRARFEREYGALVERQRGEVSKAEREALAKELVEESFIPAYEWQIEEIRSLGIPSGDENQVESFLVSMEETLDSSHDQPLKFIRGDSESLETFEEAKNKAEAYGFTYCPR